MNTKKVWLSVAASAILATGLGAANYYLPLGDSSPTDENGSMWHLIGIPGFAGASSAGAFNAWQAVTDIGNDDYATPGAKDSDLTYNLVRVKAIDDVVDSSNNNIEFQQVELRINSTLFKYDATSPWYITYVDADGDGTPDVRIDYMAFLDGKQIELQYKRNDVYSDILVSALNANNTYDNPATAVAKTGGTTTPSASILDVIDMDLTNNPGWGIGDDDNTSDLFDKDTHLDVLDSTNGRVRMYEWDPTASNWNLYDSANEKGNDFTELKAGQGYWIRLDNKGTTGNQAGLVLGTSSLDSSGYMPGSQFVDNGIGTTNGWNLMSFGDEPIRYSQTGLRVDVSFADANLSRVLVIEDAYRANKVEVALNNNYGGASNAENLALMARKINYAIERAYRDGEIVGDNFNIRAYPSATNTELVFLSDQEFTISEKASSLATNQVDQNSTTTLVGNFGDINVSYGFSFGGRDVDTRDINNTSGSATIKLYAKYTLDDGSIVTDNISEASITTGEWNTTITELVNNASALYPNSRWTMTDTNASTEEFNVTAKPFWGASMNFSTTSIILETSGGGTFGPGAYVGDGGYTKMLIKGNQTASRLASSGGVGSVLTETLTGTAGGTPTPAGATLANHAGYIHYGQDQNWTISFSTANYDQLDVFTLRLLKGVSQSAGANAANTNGDGELHGTALSTVPELIFDGSASLSSLGTRIKDAVLQHPIYRSLIYDIKLDTSDSNEYNITFVNRGWDGYVNSSLQGIDQVNGTLTALGADGVGIEINASLSTLTDVNSSDDLFQTVTTLAGEKPVIDNLISSEDGTVHTVELNITTTSQSGSGGATSVYGEFALAVTPNISTTSVTPLMKTGVNRPSFKVNGVEVLDSSDAGVTNVATFLTDIQANTKIGTSATSTSYVTDAFALDLNFSNADNYVMLVGTKRFTVADGSYTRIYKVDALKADSRLLLQEGTDSGYVSLTATSGTTAATAASHIATQINSSTDVDLNATSWSDTSSSDGRVYLMVVSNDSIDFDVKEDVLASSSGTQYSPSGSILTEVYSTDTNITTKGSIRQVYQVHKLAKGTIDVASNDRAFSPSTDWNEGKVTLNAFVEDLKANEAWVDDYPTSGTLYTIKETTTVNKKPRIFVTAATDLVTGTISPDDWQKVDVTRAPEEWYDPNDHYNLFWTEKERGYWVYLDEPVANPISIDSTGTSFEPTMTKHYNNDPAGYTIVDMNTSSDAGTVYNLLRGTLTVSVSGLISSDEVDTDSYKGSSAVVYALVGGEKVYLVPNTASTFVADLNNFELKNFNDSQSISGITVYASNGQGDVVEANISLNYVKPSKPDISWNDGATIIVTDNGETIDQYRVWSDNISEIDPTLNSTTFTPAELAAGYNICQYIDWDDSNYTSARVAAETLVVAGGTVYNSSNLFVTAYAPLYKGTHVLEASPGNTDSNAYNYNTDCTADGLLADGANSGVQFQTLAGTSGTLAIAYEPIKDSGTGAYLELSSGTPLTMYVSFPVTVGSPTAVAKIDYLEPYAVYGSTPVQKRFYVYDQANSKMYTGVFEPRDADGGTPYDQQASPLLLEEVSTTQTLDKP